MNAPSCESGHPHQGARTASNLAPLSKAGRGLGGAKRGVRTTGDLMARIPSEPFREWLLAQVRGYLPRIQRARMPSRKGRPLP